MTAKKYRLRQRIKKFLIFYVFIAVLFVVSYTFSRYVALTEEDANIDIAKFNITLNDMSITEEKPVALNISNLLNTAENKIAPNNMGYFEFNINPKGTEVSLEYELKFNLTNLYKDITLVYYTINDEETQYPISDTNIVQGDLLLPDTKSGFTDSDKINIKVYWSWTGDDIENPNIDELDNKNIGVTAIIRQKIK